MTEIGLICVGIVLGGFAAFVLGSLAVIAFGREGWDQAQDAARAEFGAEQWNAGFDAARGRDDGNQ